MNNMSSQKPMISLRNRLLLVTLLAGGLLAGPAYALVTWHVIDWLGMMPCP